MNNHQPHLFTWVGLLLVGGGLMTYSLDHLARFAGSCLLVGALFAFLDWLAYIAVLRLSAATKAIAYTERVRVMEAAARLTPDQSRLLETAVPVVSVLAGEPTPSYYLRVTGGEVPFQFIHQFLDLSTGGYLCPVSTWGEGSKQREWAQLLTNHLVVMGLAEGARGNHPARWVDQVRAMAWMGVD